MVKVTYGLEDGIYRSLDVRGHAEFGEYGQDLICASVSSITFGLMNALDGLQEDIEIKQLKDEIVISSRSDSQIVQDYFELVIMQFKTIEESYGDFIKVERK